MKNNDPCQLGIIQSTALFHMHKLYTCKFFAIRSKYTHISKSIFNLRSHANSVHISILKDTLDQFILTASMYRLLVEKQRRQLPYYLCTGLALGLSHEKTIWEKQRSREWWTDIVKGTFSDDQWMENFRMTKATFEI